MVGLVLATNWALKSTFFWQTKTFLHGAVLAGCHVQRTVWGLRHALKAGLRLGFRLGCDRVRSCGMHCVCESPHKDKSTRMCICVRVQYIVTHSHAQKHTRKATATTWWTYLLWFVSVFWVFIVFHSSRELLYGCGIVQLLSQLCLSLQVTFLCRG